MKVVFSARARSSLREIALTIAERNKPRAVSFTRELRVRAMQLADMPYAFRLIPRYENHGVRRRPHRNYLIFYRVETRRIFIVDLIHGARDYATMLFPTQEADE